MADDRRRLHPLYERAQTAQKHICSMLDPFNGFLSASPHPHDCLRQAIQRGQTHLMSRRPRFAAVSASQPDAPKKKRKRKKTRTGDSEDPSPSLSKPLKPAQEPAKPKDQQRSWLWWQNKKSADAVASSEAAEKQPGTAEALDQKKNFIPWFGKKDEPKAEPVEESEFVRFLDTYRDAEPRDEIEETIKEVEEIRPFLNREQNMALDRKIWENLFKNPNFRVKDKNGKEMSLRRAVKKDEEAYARRQMSADDPQIQKISHEDKMDRIHGSQLRQDKTKMWLRPDEADELELDLLGKGHGFSPRKIFGKSVGLVHDFAWGIFGRIPELRETMSEEWARKDPQKVLWNQDFYDDLIYHSPRTELTVHMVAHRPLSLIDLRNKFLDRHAFIASRAPYSDQEIPLLPETIEMLAHIKKRWTVEYFKHSDLIDKKGRIRPGSQLILTCGARGQLSAEAITPGTLAEQTTVPIATWHDPYFTSEVLTHFLGRHPADEDGKLRVGNGALWVANGFDFRPPEMQPSPNVFYASESPDIDPEYQNPHPMEAIPNSLDVFSIAQTTEQPLLFSNPTDSPYVPVLAGSDKL